MTLEMISLETRAALLTLPDSAKQEWEAWFRNRLAALVGTADVGMMNSPRLAQYSAIRDRLVQRALGEMKELLGE